MLLESQHKCDVGNGCIEDGIYDTTTYQHITNNKCDNALCGAIILASVSNSTGSRTILIQGNEAVGCGTTNAGRHLNVETECVTLTYQTTSTGTLSGVQVLDSAFDDFQTGVMVDFVDGLAIAGNTFSIGTFCWAGVRWAGWHPPKRKRRRRGHTHILPDNNTLQRTAAAASAGLSYYAFLQFSGNSKTARWINVTVRNSLIDTGQKSSDLLFVSSLSATCGTIQAEAVHGSGIHD
jgi:hypothetical protein